MSTRAVLKFAFLPNLISVSRLSPIIRVDSATSVFSGSKSHAKVFGFPSVSSTFDFQQAPEQLAIAETTGPTSGITKLLKKQVQIATFSRKKGSGWIYSILVTIVFRKVNTNQLVTPIMAKLTLRVNLGGLSYQ